MSYEVINEKTTPCACGRGVVKLTIFANDWSQFREVASIDCPSCKNSHYIESKHFCPKPKHDYTICYLVDNKEPYKRIQLDFEV